MPIQFSILDTGCWMKSSKSSKSSKSLKSLKSFNDFNDFDGFVEHRASSIECRVSSIRFMILVCCIFCYVPSIASAEYEVEHAASLFEVEHAASLFKVDDEVSTNKLAACSTLPYLKRLGHERIQPGTLYLYLSPQDAHVYLDGKTLEDLKRENVTVVQRKAGKLPFLAFENLVPGTHTLRVTKSSHNTRLKYVLIESGTTRLINIKLHNRWRLFAAEILTLASLAGIGIAVSLLVH